MSFDCGKPYDVSHVANQSIFTLWRRVRVSEGTHRFRRTETQAVSNQRSLKNRNRIFAQISFKYIYTYIASIQTVISFNFLFLEFRNCPRFLLSSPPFFFFLSILNKDGKKKGNKTKKKRKINVKFPFNGGNVEMISSWQLVWEGRAQNFLTGRN